VNWISDFSLWWLVPGLGLSAFFTWIFYAKKAWLKEITNTRRYLLIGLRFITLSTLIFLILGVLFENKTYRNEKPIFITLTDNSSSMLNYKDSAEVKKDVPELNKWFKTRFKDKFDFVDIKTSGESVDFSGEETNISSALESVYESYYNRNIGGIAIVSDGNYNQGTNPIYAAEKFKLTPFFTLGVGDTVVKRDQYIKNVNSNDFAFLKNQFPVDVEIEAKKLAGQSAEISIYQKGKKIKSQLIQYGKEEFDFKQVSFLLDATQVGIQRYTAVLSVLGQEYNTENNRRDFYIEVLDARSKVLLLADAPHPDITALKYVIEKDENLSVEAKTTATWKRDLKEVDLVVWHEPGINKNKEISDLLAKNKVPVLYVIGLSSKATNLKSLGLSESFPSTNQTDDVEPYFNSSFNAFEISDELQTFFNYLPPLKTRYGKVEIPNDAQVFLKQRIGNIKKKEPLMYFGKNQNQKYGVIYGEGIWRWKLNDYVKNSSFEHFEELVQKITQYLLVKQNSSPFRLEMPKKIFKSTELEMKAEFYNASLDLTTAAKISLKLTNEKNEVNKYDFAVTGNYYRLNLGKMQPGTYSWTATAKFGDQDYVKSGQIIVQDILIEKLDNQANHSSLRQMAFQSKGIFVALSDKEKLIAAIDSRDDMVSRAYAESSFLDLIDWKVLFFILLVLITTEWFLRRYWGGY
jgi:hypothetical protein